MVASQKDKLGQYNRVGITTSNQEMLILKCYDGVLGCLRTAKELMPDKKKLEDVNNNMIKAQKGLGLLAGAVNSSGEDSIGENLLKLYDFLIRYLIDANIKKDTNMVEEAIEMISDMRGSWIKAFEKMHEESAVSANTIAPIRHSSLNILG